MGSRGTAALALAALLGAATPTAAGAAASGLRIEDALREAVSVSPRILSARAQWQAFLERVPQARALEDPMLTVTSYHGPAGNIPFHRTMDNDVGFSQKIPGLHKRALRASIAGHEAEAARAQYLETIRDVVARTRMAFADDLSAFLALRALHEEARILADLAKLTGLHYSVGHGSHHDVLRASVEMFNVQNEERLARSDMDAARSRLLALMHRPPGSLLPDPVGDVAPVLPPPLETLIGRARRERPLILAARSVVEGKRGALALARRERAPDYTVMLDHQFQNSGFDTYDAQVSINLPFLVKGKYDAAIRQARQDVSAAVQDLDAQETEALGDLSAAYAHTTSLAHVLAGFRPTVIALSDEAVRSSLASYEVGQTDFLNVLESQRTRRIAWTTYYRMYGQFLNAWADLERAVGADVESAGPVPAESPTPDASAPPGALTTGEASQQAPAGAADTGAGDDENRDTKGDGSDSAPGGNTATVHGGATGHR